MLEIWNGQRGDVWRNYVGMLKLRCGVAVY